MRALRSIIILGLLGVLLAPSTAAAQKCTSDNVAVVDQYCELLPTAEGSAPAELPQPRLRHALPPDQRTQLWRAGPAGRALLSMPQGARLRADGESTAPQLLPGTAATVARWLAENRERGDTSLRATGEAAWHGARLSELFRWLMLMSTVGLVGTAWVRRRR